MAKQKRAGNRAYFALCMAVLALVINFWAWSLLSPLGTKYANDLSLQPVTLSLLLAVPVIVGSLGRVILGMLTDTFGGRVMFAATCFLTAIPVAGLTLAHGFGQLVFVAFFLGLGGAVFAVGVPYVSAWFPAERRGLMLGIYSMGNIGTALSAFMTPRMANLIGLNFTFLTVALLLLLLGLAFAFRGKNSPSWKPSGASPIGRLVAAARQRITWDLACVYIISFGAFVAFGVYLPVLLKISYGLSLTDAASRAAGFVVLATLARPIGGWVSDKISGQAVIRFSLLAVAVLASFVALQPTLELQTTVAYLSLAFMLGCCNGAVFALIGKRTKAVFMGSVTGLVGAAGGLGGFLPPLILGATYQSVHSYAPALVLLSVGAFVVLLYVHVRFKDPSVF